ncbi:MAG: PEGA domain-containing protein [Candidatus Latescibacteria bacterium]|nr:PEGA domain-containing protein [Candidatus Latescibacterota bacterium]
MSEADRPFTRINSPFHLGVPVRDKAMFFGRHDDFATVRNRLLADQEGILILLVGARRSGKTSILFQIEQNELGPEFLPIFIDMQGMAGISSDRDFLEYLATLILDKLDDNRLPREYYDFQGANNGLLPFDKLITDIKQAYPDQRLLILIDEAEQLQGKIDRGEITGAILNYMASLLERQQISFCFTGSPNMAQQVGEEWRRLAAKGVPQEIGFLTFNDAVRLIQEPLAGQVVYEEGVVEAIYNLTHGHPYFTQFFCSYAVDHLNDHERKNLTLEDLDEVVISFINNPPPHLDFQWDNLDANAQLVLSLVSEECEGTQVRIDAESLVKAIKDRNYPLNLRADAINVALATLYQEKWLDSSGDGHFYFQVDLYRLWVRRERSIWQLVGESDLKRPPRRWPALVGGTLAVAAAAWLVFGGSEPPPANRPAAVTTGSIWVETRQPNVEIWLDGTLAKQPRSGTAQLPDLAPGSYLVELRHPDFYPHRQSVQVSADRQDTVLAIDRLVRRKGTLAVNSQPSGARVHIRGDSFDTTLTAPIDSLMLLPGSYSLITSKADFADQTQKVEITPDNNQHINFDLATTIGTLTLDSTPAGATVLLDGTSQGVTPLQLERLPAGPHRLQLQLAQHTPVDTTVVVIAGQATPLVRTLTLSPAQLHIRSQPPGATLYINGDSLGLTPLNLALPPGDYRLQLHKEGYDSHAEERTFAPGEKYAPAAVSLVQQFGTVRIAGVLTGTILIDGGPKRHELPPASMTLPVGRHMLQYIDGSRSLDTTVYVYKDSTIKVKF